jgi:hypothetical protein
MGLYSLSALSAIPLMALSVMLAVAGCSSEMTVPAASLPGNYYVSPDGSDNNSGSESAPWRHIQYAVNQAGAGSTIYVMDGIYNETVIFRRAGSAEAGYLTLQNYPDHQPVIDGTGLPVDGETGLIVIEDGAYIRLSGFEIRNLSAGGDPSAFPAGIWITGRGDHLEIRNNIIHHIENSCGQCGAHGIAVYGRDPDSSIHDLLIDGNELRDNRLGWSETLALNGNVEAFVISNNVIHDNDNIAIDLIGYEGENPDPALDRVRHGTVADNQVYNISTADNPAYGGERSAAGIYIDGGTDITIERNTVHHADIGIELASEHAGRSTDHIIVRNNFIYANTQAGLALGGYDSGRGSTENCVIVHNTLYANHAFADWGAELYVQFGTRYNLIQNNIFYAGEAARFIESWSPVMTGNIVDSNLYFPADGTWSWRGITYLSFADYRQGTGNDTHSLIGLDPLLVDTAAPDLHLQPTSPAIDQGGDMAQAGQLDIDGQPRRQGTAVDWGADEIR